MKSLISYPARLYRFYYEGFRNMSAWGKKVWIIIIIKLFIIFIILKIFFLPDFLKKEYDTDERRGQYVLDQLTKPAETND